jgi:hypothetical protein
MTEMVFEQDLASMEGPRALKEPGSPLWCWQTISALQHLWQTFTLDYDRYMKVWTEAEEHRVWEKVPYDNPFGTKENMLQRLALGDQGAARVRVMEKAMNAEPLGKNGGRRNKGESHHAGQHTTRNGRQSTDYLSARIARDHPDIWERMKQGEFASVAEAARAAGIKLYKPKKIVLSDNVDRVADALIEHYGQDEIEQLRKRLMSGGNG